MNDESNLSAEELETLNIEFAKRGRSPGILWLLWLFLGVFGAHRFYLGHRIGWLYVALALLAFPTWGITAAILVLLLGIDAFTNNGRLAVVNGRIKESVLSEVLAPRQATADIPDEVATSQDAVCAVATSEEAHGPVACHKCGSEVSDASLFCSECGTSLREGIKSEPEKAESDPIDKVEPSTESGSKDARNGCILMVVLAILIVLGIRGCVRWLFHDDPPPAQTPSVSTEALPRPVGYCFDTDGTAQRIMGEDLKTPAIADTISASFQIDESYLYFGRDQYRIMITVTSNDKWRMFKGHATVLMDVGGGQIVERPLSISIPPMSSVFVDDWARPESGKPSGPAVTGAFVAVWKGLDESVPPFEIAAFQPGLGYSTIHLVTSATRRDELQTIADAFKGVYESRLGGFQLHFYTVAKADYARKRAMEHAFADYSINFKTGYESLTAD